MYVKGVARGDEPIKNYYIALSYVYGDFQLVLAQCFNFIVINFTVLIN